MASYFNLTLDTLAPSGLTVQVNDDAIYASNVNVTLTINLDDEDTTGYQMKIWGIQGAINEGDSAWETYTPSKDVLLPVGDGLKTVSVKVRDNVGNESSTATDSITLDTIVPVVTISGPDKAKISKNEGNNVAVINFISDVSFQAYKVCVVPATNSTQNSGITIGNENGSINTSGTRNSGGGLYPANTNIEVSINGADLERASPGDGVKIIKVFVQSEVGTWSVV